MNEDVSDEVQKFILETLGEGKEFVLEQTPEVAQQWLNWQIAVSTMGVVFFGFLLVGTVIATILFIRNGIQSKYRWKDRDVLGATFGCLFTAVWTLVVSYNVYNLVYVLVAPKAYFLDRFIT